MKRFRNGKAASTLYDMGIRFHETGTLKDNSGAALFDYYKCDSVTESQREALRAIVPHVRFFGMSWQYAPELRSVAIGFPKAAYFRQMQEQGNERSLSIAMAESEGACDLYKPAAGIPDRP